MPKRIALIGCGAIAEAMYLPALKKRKNALAHVFLVDPSEERLKLLSSEYNVAGTLTDYKLVIDQVDAAILATPPAMHHKMALDFLKAGKPILVEKPLAESGVQVKEIAAAAEKAGVPVFVNNTRRFFPVSQEVQRIISSGRIGEVKSIEYIEGTPFAWPAASGFYFSPDNPKGVVYDRGPHVLDLVCWWLGEKPELVDYTDDSFGGPEAVADIVLKFSGGEGHVRMSWLSKLANSFRIVGEKGEVSGSIYDWRNFTLTLAGEKPREISLKTDVVNFGQFGDKLLDNFLAGLTGFAKPFVGAEDVAASIELIDECYASRKPFDLPWVLKKTKKPARKGVMKVFVTGAAGFVGGRIAEALHYNPAYELVAGVHSWKGVANLARHGISVVQADITDPARMQELLKDVDAVVHCAVGPREVTVDGTRVVAEAAKEAGVKRFVHISTVDVYGDAEGELTEDQPLMKTGNAYGDSKIDAETVIWEMKSKGLPVTVLRPAILYGPNSAIWTVRPAERLRSGKFGHLGELGEGWCNLTYIDDLVALTLAALENEAAVGEAFNTAGTDRITWNEYHDALSRELGYGPLKPFTQTRSNLRTKLMDPLKSVAKMVLAKYQPQLMEMRARYSFMRKLMGVAEVEMKSTPGGKELELYARKVIYKVDKAEELLGYKSAVDAEEGVRRSGEWLRHHGLAKTDA